MTRALVLGGGGPVGIGWESGLTLGLAEKGIHFAEADAIYGTSAGSVVGANIALGLDLRGAIEQVAATASARGVAPVADGAGGANRMTALIEAMVAAVTSTAPPEEARKTLGRISLESDVVSEERFVGLFANLAGHDWPRHFSCTAVDTATGEFVLWREVSGIDLQRGVASSCSVPGVFPPVSIGESRYMDGGMRTGLNADVAVGHDRVVVVSCTPLTLPEGLSNPIFDALVGSVQTEIATLESSGSKVEAIEPNAAMLEVSGWGTALMDTSRAAAAFEVGLEQGTAEADRIGSLWNAG